VRQTGAPGSGGEKVKSNNLTATGAPGSGGEKVKSNNLTDMFHPTLLLFAIG
jgi:hypothetical protein